MSARNAAAAVKSAKSASAENCDKKRARQVSADKENIFFKISGSDKMFLHRP